MEVQAKAFSRPMYIEKSTDETVLRFDNH